MLCRFSSDKPKAIYLTGGGPSAKSVRESAEVIVVNSNEPMKKKKKKLEASHVYEGLNIKLFPIR
jgi:hypothetical protein